MEQHEPYNHHLLFNQVAEGNEAAYTQLFKLYTPKLYNHIFKIVKQELLAREFVQEAFIQLWVYRTEIPNMKFPSSWLYKVAGNLALQYLRKEANRNNLQAKVYERMQPAAYDVSEQVEQKELEGIIRNVVEGLPEKRKEVYLMSREEGLSHQQIADRMGIKVSSVKTHLGLALQTLREELHKKTGLSITVLAILLNG